MQEDLKKILDQLFLPADFRAEVYGEEKCTAWR